MTEPHNQLSAGSESALWERVEFFSAPLIALALTPFLVSLILWSVKP